MESLIIKAEKLSKRYKLPGEEIPALQDVDLEIYHGDFIAIMGPSGSGKTTLLDILGCLDSPSSGNLSVFGQEVSHAKESALPRIRRGNIGFVFQDFYLLPTLTAVENVKLPLYFARKPLDHKKSVHLLEKVGLGHRVNHLPKELSGGEMQRIAIARALVTSPKILLADEPTGNLDSKKSQEIFDLFRRLNRQDGVTTVVVTHDERLGNQAGRIIHLLDGKINRETKGSLA